MGSKSGGALGSFSSGIKPATTAPRSPSSPPPVASAPPPAANTTSPASGGNTPVVKPPTSGGNSGTGTTGASGAKTTTTTQSTQATTKQSSGHGPARGQSLVMTQVQVASAQKETIRFRTTPFCVSQSFSPKLGIAPKWGRDPRESQNKRRKGSVADSAPSWVSLLSFSASSPVHPAFCCCHKRRNATLFSHESRLPALSTSTCLPS